MPNQLTMRSPSCSSTCRPRMRLVIATREDPQMPLARLRGGGSCRNCASRTCALTQPEAAALLNEAMGLQLSVEDIAALETRTEGWVAGLQLAALSLQGQTDASSFIQFFSGSHHFVLDYLLEEVLHRQSESVQTFLLRTSILDQMCGQLCDVLLGDTTPPDKQHWSISSATTCSFSL